MPDPSPLRLEQGSALSMLWESTDDLRQAAAELQAAADAHAMTTFQLLRDLADGGTLDPSALLRSRGRVEALLSRLVALADLEVAHLRELPITLSPPDLSDPLEARALERFRARCRRHAPAPPPKPEGR